MFAETVEAKRLAGVEEFSVGADFRVAMFRRPLGNVRVEAFAILHHRRE